MWLSSFETFLTLLTDWIVLTITLILYLCRCLHKVSKVRFELITEHSQLKMAENLVRVGVSLVFSNCLATMNNKYLKAVDERKARTNGLPVDANNFYGGIMQTIPVPLREFEIIDVELRSSLKTTNNSDIGFVLEVDINYPDGHNNMHNDYPLATTTIKLYWNMLSEYQMGFLDQAANRRVTTPKLLQTIFAEDKYTVHYIKLKLYVHLGPKVTKVEQVLQFKKEKWLEPYIILNTRMRT